MSPVTALCYLVGFVAIIGAYVALTLTGHDATGLTTVVVTLLGVTGLGAHIEKRTQEQNGEINKIKEQTNGVLDRRIHDGSKRAVTDVLREHKLIPPAE